MVELRILFNIRCIRYNPMILIFVLLQLMLVSSLSMRVIAIQKMILKKIRICFRLSYGLMVLFNIYVSLYLLTIACQQNHYIEKWGKIKAYMGHRHTYILLAVKFKCKLFFFLLFFPCKKANEIREFLLTSLKELTSITDYHGNFPHTMSASSSSNGVVRRASLAKNYTE